MLQDEEQDVDAIAEGEEAERLLKSPIFAKAVKKTEDTYTALWKRSDASPAERESYWHRLQVLGDVLLNLNAIRQDGKILAAKKLQEERRDAAAAKSRNPRAGK